MSFGKLLPFIVLVSAFGGFTTCMTGCTAGGYEPGPQRDAPGSVTLGTMLGLNLSGERDRSLQIVGLKGDGAHWPSADMITYDSSASGPIGTRAESQSMVVQAQTTNNLILIQGIAQELRTTAAALVSMRGELLAQTPPKPTTGTGVGGLGDRAQAMKDMVEYLQSQGLLRMTPVPVSNPATVPTPP